MTNGGGTTSSDAADDDEHDIGGTSAEFSTTTTSIHNNTSYGSVLAGTVAAATPTSNMLFLPKKRREFSFPWRTTTSAEDDKHQQTSRLLSSSYQNQHQQGGRFFEESWFSSWSIRRRRQRQRQHDGTTRSSPRSNHEGGDTVDCCGRCCSCCNVVNTWLKRSREDSNNNTKLCCHHQEHESPMTFHRFQTNRKQQPLRRSSKRRKPWLLSSPELRVSHVLVWICVALIAVLLLTSFTEEQFRLNPGETRPIPSPNPFFYRAVSEESWPTSPDGSETSQIGADIYYYSNGGCPSLDGPIVHMESNHTTHLREYGDYEYDYFYLNPGTIMTITFEAIEGSFGLFLLKGKDTFDSWAGGNDLISKPLLKGYISTTSSSKKKKNHDENDDNLQPQPKQTFEYHIDHADVYYVGYDNPQHKHHIPSFGVINIQLKATSYNLDEEHKLQTCHSYESYKHCCLPLKFAFFRNDCIIVQGTETTQESIISIVNATGVAEGQPQQQTASLSRSSNNNNNNTSKIYFNDIQDVTIDVLYKRRWSSALIVVALVVTLFGIWCGRSSSSLSSATSFYSNNDDEDGSGGNARIIYGDSYSQANHIDYDESTFSCCSPLLPNDPSKNYDTNEENIATEGTTAPMFVDDESPPPPPPSPLKGNDDDYEKQLPTQILEPPPSPITLRLDFKKSNILSAVPVPSSSLS